MESVAQPTPPPAETAMPPPPDPSPEQPASQPPETTSAAEPAASAEPTPAAAPAPLADSLAALGSMWNGWMSSTPAPAPAPAPPPTAPAQPRDAPPPASGPDQVASAAATAGEWLQGAGKLWETAVKDVGDKLKEATSAVDTATLNDQVSVLRQRSAGFVEDVSKSVQSMNLNIDQTELSKRAELISTSTRQLLDHASQSLQKGKAEALEIFVDAPTTAGPAADPTAAAVSVAPWDSAALPEAEHANANALRQEMLKIVVDAIYSKKKRTDLFLSDAATRNNFTFNFDANSGMALAALDADKNMRRLRAGLVPGKMKEDAFWTVYFYHVHRVRQTLVANDGVMPEAPTDEDDDDPAALFADDDDDEELAALNSPTIAKVRPSVEYEAPPEEGGERDGDGKRNWDDEIDAIFDEE